MSVQIVQQTPLFDANLKETCAPKPGTTSDEVFVAEPAQHAGGEASYYSTLIGVGASIGSVAPAVRPRALAARAPGLINVCAR